MSRSNPSPTSQMALRCGIALLAMQAALQGAVLTNRYSFNETTGTTAVDSVSGKNGTLMNTAVFTGAGTVYLDSYQVASSDPGAYVVLPENMVTGLTAITIETWYTPTHNPNANADWNRIWDFFNATSHFFMRSGNATYGLRGDITTSSSSQGLDAPTVPDGAESHVVWTSDGATGLARIYVNGVEVASATGFTNTPAAMGATPTNWIGRSKFASDPYLSGTINEFRIYSGALTPLEAAASYQAGTENPSTSYGTVSSIAVQLPNSILVGNVEQTRITAATSVLTNTAVDISFDPGLTFSSSASGIISVDATGKVTAVAPGTATITAVYTSGSLSRTNSKSVAVVSASAKLMHRYSFDNEMSADISDSIGTANGTVQLAGIQSGGQLILDGQSLAYAELPAGMISTNTVHNNAVSFESWVTFPSTNRNWANLFAFGNTIGADGGNYIFFTPHSGNSDYRFVATSTQPGWSGSGEHFAAASGNLDYRTNIHVVCVMNFGRDQAAIYVNGVRVAQNTTFGRELYHVLNNYSYLGKSTYTGDPTCIMSLDEFRIYDGALTAPQINAAYQTYGASSTNINPGVFQSISLSAPSSLTLGWQAQVNALGNWQNATNVNLFGDLDFRLTSSDTNILTVTDAGLVTARSVGTAYLTAQYQGNLSTQSVTVVSHPAATLVHRYDFGASSGAVVADLVGGANGHIVTGTNTLGVTNAIWTGTGQLAINTNSTLGATDTYVDLPDGIISVLTNGASFEFWVTTYTSEYWARVFDFGSLPGPPNPPPAGVFFTRGGRLDWVSGFVEAGGLTANTKTHVAVVYNQAERQSKVYVNGALKVTGAPGVLPPLSNINDTNVWLGRSLYSAPITPQYYDPYLQGIYDEFRIYSGLLSAEAVQASYAVGPDLPVAAAPALSYSRNAGNLVLSWPTNAVGFAPYGSATLGSGAAWVEVPGIISTEGTNRQLSVPISSGGALFIRLQKSP